MYCHACEDEAPTEAEGSDDLDGLAYLTSLREHPAAARLQTLVYQYEKASALICEVCGAPGKIDHKRLGRVEPLCAAHYALTLRTSPHTSPAKYAVMDDDAAKDILSRIDGLAAHPPAAGLFSHFFEVH